VRDLLAAGFELGEPLFARDGMGRAFDGLTEDEVAAADDLCQASPGIKGETVSREETGNADARKYKDLRESLRLPFMSFFMDGRNEHGTHLLPLPGCRISDEETIADQLDPRGDLAEAIFAEAEALGHEAGHVITTIWRWDRSDEYYDFVRVDPILTEAFYGTPEEQRDYLAQGDMLSCLSEEAQRADTESAANDDASLTPSINQESDNG
jgi:hypothetical protein